MIHSKMYKKYYPLKTNNEILAMNEHDKKRLAGWIRRMPTDITTREINMIKRGSTYFDTIRLKYPEYCGYLANKILTNQRLDVVDVNSINTTLYRNKYISLLSPFLFPIKTEHLNEKGTSP